MKNVIVTGCNGQLGRAINQVLADNAEYNLINTDVPELDITDIDKVMAFAREIKPYAIINCAAYTNVNGCETDYDNAFRVNAIGPRNLSIAARETGAKMIQISTDYVFSGNTDKHYKEQDEVSPMSAYGRTKLYGENFVKEFAQRYFILRTAWLYGEGKNFVKTMLMLSEKNDKVQVVNDQFGTPTGQNGGGQHVIGQTVGQLGGHIGGGGGDHHQIGTLSQCDMLHLMDKVAVKGVHYDLIARELLKGQRGHKFGGVLGHDHLHIGVELDQSGSQGSGLIRGDAAAYADNNVLSSEHSAS